jgi:hypothetical protein
MIQMVESFFLLYTAAVSVVLILGAIAVKNSDR